jgi:formylglycine-generating enzyme required for sulfatase activity
MTFVFIPPGTFTMGSPQNELGRYDNELQRQVTLDQGYYLQTTEVTQGQWSAIMHKNPSHFKKCGDDCPVENISYYDIKAYINKLNTKDQERNYRLPTEEEWEYAARAGSTTAFANGDISETECSYEPNLNLVGWYCYNSEQKTHPVALKNPNDWGLYDMHGNVWEQCVNWYAEYKDGINPKEPMLGQIRVIRGGAWYLGAKDCRAATKDWFSLGEENNSTGFRLICTPNNN